MRQVKHEQRPSSDTAMTQQRPIVIAHRGACGYLPEHSLAAKALAHGMGADYLEQDVVLSADGVPVVLHDIHLESTTDVELRFPDRARKDGRYYALDFSLAELQTLRLHERSRRDNEGNEVAIFKDRFPLQATSFVIPTLEEEIHFIDGLNKSRKTNTGLYIELKAPQWHLKEGHDIATQVMAVLNQTGYAQRPDQVMLQCFDDATLQRLHKEFATKLPLIQLIGENSWGEDSKVDYTFLQSPAGLDHIASYAQGIGPWVPQIFQGKSPGGEVLLSNLVQEAHARKLLVHPYTLREDALPSGVGGFTELLCILFDQAKVDGAFSDFPDRLVAYLDTRYP